MSDEQRTVGGFNFGQVEEIAVIEDQGTVVHIIDLNDRPMYYQGPDGERPVTITVAGAHSRKARAVDRELRGRKIKPNQLTGDKFRDDAIEKLAACTLAWDGFFDGEAPVEMNRHNARRLYAAATWIFDQVQEAHVDHKRFTGTSSPQQ